MHCHAVVYANARLHNAGLYSDLQSALGADPCLRDRLSRICTSDWCCVVLDLVWPGHANMVEAARVLGIGTVVKLADRLPAGVAVEEYLVPDGLAEVIGEHLLAEALYQLRDARDYLDTCRIPVLLTRLQGDQTDLVGTLCSSVALRNWVRHRFPSGWMAAMVDLVYGRREFAYSGFARWLGEQIVTRLENHLPVGVGPRDLTRPRGFAEGLGMAIANELMRALRDALRRSP